MSNFGDKVQPAVKKETKNVAIYTVVGVVVMWVGFLILHLIWPEKIPFDYRVILGGIGGGAVAVLELFLMGMAVQKSSVRDRRGGSKAADAGKLFAEKPDADALGSSGDCASMLPVCRRNPAAFNSGNGHQAEGHKKQHKALNLIFGESRKDGTAFLNRNSEAAIRL